MNVQKRQSANEENGSTPLPFTLCAFAHFRLCSTILLVFGIHTMNESSLFRVVFAAVLSFRSYSILGLGFIQEIGTTTHQINVSYTFLLLNSGFLQQTKAIPT